MMKNTEWGAVSYLSYSIYGINKEINTNNNSNHITGYSSTSSADQSKYPGTYGLTSDITLPYNTETGYLASTTGNISGVYDICGGTHEYMAAYKEGSFGKSGFEVDPASIYGSKYFDIYSSTSTVNNYSDRILGDATGEMGPFYIYIDADDVNRIHNNWGGDFTYFVNDERPWFGRGGSLFSGVLGGQFYFERYPGSSDENITFRVVIAK